MMIVFTLLHRKLLNCKIFSWTLHLTIFGMLKYVPKYGQMRQIQYLGCILGHVKYGQMGVPEKILQNAVQTH